MLISRHQFANQNSISLPGGLLATVSIDYEDLGVRFTDGRELLLPGLRNSRNTEIADLIAVLSDSTKNVFLAGGVMAYVLAPAGSIVSSFQTGYLPNNAPPYEERLDISGVQVFCQSGCLVMIWDCGVLVLDSKFGLISKTNKFVDDILEEKTEKELVFVCQSTGERFTVKVEC